MKMGRVLYQALKELDELSAIIEDKKNVINLAMLNEKLNEKNDINNDILMIIYDFHLQHNLLLL